MMFPLSHGIFGAAQASTPSVDKTALLAALAAAAALDESDYTPESWAVLSAAVTAGQTVYDDADATQQQVDDATQAIAAAIAALEPVAESCTVALTHDILAVDPSYLPADINGQEFSITAPGLGAAYAASTSISDLKPLPTSGIVWVAFEIIEWDEAASTANFMLIDAVTTHRIIVAQPPGTEGWQFSYWDESGTVAWVNVPVSASANPLLGVGSDGAIYTVDDSGAVVDAADLTPAVGVWPAAPLAGSTSLAFVGVLVAYDPTEETVRGRFITSADEFPQLPGGEGYDWCGNPLPESPAPDLPTEIGQAFGGGFYIGDITVADGGPDDGTYAVIMAGPASEAELEWKDPRSDTPGTNSENNGRANTLAMAGLPSLHPAGMHCLGYTGGGFNDWYMPASNELLLVWFNRAALHDLGMAAANYWSSTQAGVDFGRAQNFSSGNTISASKAVKLRVRPVRRIRKEETPSHVTFTYAEDGWEYIMQGVVDSRPGPGVDGSFHSWRGVVPSEDLNLVSYPNLGPMNRQQFEQSIADFRSTILSHSGYDVGDSTGVSVEWDDSTPTTYSDNEVVLQNRFSSFGGLYDTLDDALAAKETFLVITPVTFLCSGSSNPEDIGEYRNILSSWPVTSTGRCYVNLPSIVVNVDYGET